MVVVCCVCHKVKSGEEWLELPMPSGYLPSHGYCPECAAEARRNLEEIKARRAAEKLRQSA